MATIKTDTLTSVSTNTDLTLSANGTGGVKVSDYFQLTKGSDIASGTTLTLGTDGNAFDVTGTTTITSIATQGIGSHITLHFDGALTFTHHSTNLILPGAASITTAAGDIAVMYEYASADWRCISYTKASGVAVVAASGGATTFIAKNTPSGASTSDFTNSSIFDGTYPMVMFIFDLDHSDDGTNTKVRIAHSGTYQTGTYEYHITELEAGTTGYQGEHSGSADAISVFTTMSNVADAKCSGKLCIYNDWSNTTYSKFIAVEAVGWDGTSDELYHCV